MSGYIEGTDRGQTTLFPDRLEGWIADFRHDNGSSIRKTCALFVELCRRIGVRNGEYVAIGGSRIEAINNRDENFTEGKIASRIAHLEASIERYLKEMLRIDA